MVDAATAKMDIDPIKRIKNYMTSDLRRKWLYLQSTCKH